MHNSHISKEHELPSTKQLIVSTMIAFIVAMILLVTVILPAEYGIDPTGLGKVIGLTKMGDIKTQLASEAKQSEKEPALTEANEEAVSSETLPIEAIPLEVEERTVQLKPGEAAEIKLSMMKGAIVTYHWFVDIGHVNYDTHADGQGIKYFGYTKGKATTEDKGELKAEFDGKHGWFWRNRSDKNVTVTLKVSGDYSGIHRVL